MEYPSFNTLLLKNFSLPSKLMVKIYVVGLVSCTSSCTTALTPLRYFNLTLIKVITKEVDWASLKG